MKVISGIYKGRNLKGFNIDGTRPTMDRVKESLFASISGYIDNANILDLFCGSGALGIEALSNGGKWCDFCDNNREVIKVVKDNINGLGIRNCEIYKMDYRDMLKKIKLMGSKYDIVFLLEKEWLGIRADYIEKIKSGYVFKTKTLLFENNDANSEDLKKLISIVGKDKVEIR